MLLILLATMLPSGMAQAAPRKATRPAAPEGKTIRDAKTTVVAPRPPAPRRLLTFQERFFPGSIRTFTTWW